MQDGLSQTVPATQREPFAPAWCVRLHRHKEWDFGLKASAWLGHIIHRELCRLGYVCRAAAFPGFCGKGHQCPSDVCHCLRAPPVSPVLVGLFGEAPELAENISSLLFPRGCS